MWFPLGLIDLIDAGRDYDLWPDFVTRVRVKFR